MEPPSKSLPQLPQAPSPSEAPMWCWVCQGGRVHTTLPSPEESLPHGRHPEQSTGWRRQGWGRWPLPRPGARHTLGAEAAQGSPIPQATEAALAECGCKPGLHDTRTWLSTWCRAASPGQEALGRALRDQLFQPTTLKPGRTLGTPGVQTRPWALVPNQSSFPRPCWAPTHRARRPPSEPWPPMGQSRYQRGLPPAAAGSRPTTMPVVRKRSQARAHTRLAPHRRAKLSTHSDSDSRAPAHSAGLPHPLSDHRALRRPEGDTPRAPQY